MPGFAIQSARQTYLVPVDAQIWVEKDVVQDGFGLEAILGEMSNRKASVVVALLEASRSNPYERRFRHYSAGLAPAVTPPNTVVMYSAALGSVVGNAGPKRSVFVNELLKEIIVPSVKGEDALKNVQAGIIAITGKQQIPWLSSTLTVTFSFSSPGKGGSDEDKPDPKCERVQPYPLPSPERARQGSANQGFDPSPFRRPRRQALALQARAGLRHQARLPVRGAGL